MICTIFFSSLSLSLAPLLSTPSFEQFHLPCLSAQVDLSVRSSIDADAVVSSTTAQPCLKIVALLLFKVTSLHRHSATVANIHRPVVDCNQSTSYRTLGDRATNACSFSFLTDGRRRLAAHRTAYTSTQTDHGAHSVSSL